MLTPVSFKQPRFQERPEPFSFCTTVVPRLIMHEAHMAPPSGLHKTGSKVAKGWGTVELGIVKSKAMNQMVTSKGPLWHLGLAGQCILNIGSEMTMFLISISVTCQMRTTRLSLTFCRMERQ